MDGVDGWINESIHSIRTIKRPTWRQCRTRESGPHQARLWGGAAVPASKGWSRTCFVCVCEKGGGGWLVGWLVDLGRVGGVLIFGAFGFGGGRGGLICVGGLVGASTLMTPMLACVSWQNCWRKRPRTHPPTYTLPTNGRLLACLRACVLALAKLLVEKTASRPSAKHPMYLQVDRLG